MLDYEKAMVMSAMLGTNDTPDQVLEQGVEVMKRWTTALEDELEHRGATRKAESERKRTGTE